MPINRSFVDRVGGNPWSAHGLLACTALRAAGRMGLVFALASSDDRPTMAVIAVTKAAKASSVGATLAKRAMALYF